MWTEFTGLQYDRSGLRYASGLTDGEWEPIVPHLPARERQGRPRTTDLREVLNGILSMASTGCQRRMLPKAFPPRGTIESALGIAMFAAIAIAAREPFTLIGAPFLALFAVGFLSVGLPLLRSSNQRAPA